MKLSKLVEHIEYELVQGSLDTEVADIAYDSRKNQRGNVVCCHCRNGCRWS